MYILDICCSALSAGEGGGGGGVNAMLANILLKNVWVNNES